MVETVGDIFGSWIGKFTGELVGGITAIFTILLLFVIVTRPDVLKTIANMTVFTFQYAMYIFQIAFTGLGIAVGQAWTIPEPPTLSRIFTLRPR